MSGTVSRLPSLGLCMAISMIAAVVSVCPVFAQEAGDVFSTPEVLDLGDGRHLFADRGFLFAPENRNKPGSKLVAVHFMRFDSTAEVPGTPVFMLAGGPGGSWFPGLRAGTEGVGHPAEGDLAVTLAMLEDLRSVADVVIIDQRGAGLSLPQMDCPNHQRLAPLDRLLSAKTLAASYKEFARTCKQAWIDQGRDPDGYTALELADDIDDLRRVLGYGKISLFGGSFGSEWGFVTLRRHREIVERVLFRGIEGTAHTFDMPTGVLNSVRAILAVAEQDVDLAPHVPEGGFLAAVGALIDKLGRDPATVRVRDPYTGEAVDVVVGAHELRRVWRRHVGRVGTQDWPASLLPLLNGDLREAAERTAQFKGAYNPAPAGNREAMFTSIDCGLQPTAERRKKLVSDPALALLGNINAHYFALCEEWAPPNARAALPTAAPSDIPALFVHGTWDLSTPLMNALEIMPDFPNGHLVVVENGTHGVLRDLYREKPDVIRPLVRRFLRGEPVDGTPDRITLPPADFAGPAD